MAWTWQPSPFYVPGQQPEEGQSYALADSDTGKSVGFLIIDHRIAAPKRESGATPWRRAQYAGRFAWELAGARGGGSLVVFVPAGGEQRGAQLPPLIDGPLSLTFPPFPS